MIDDRFFLRLALIFIGLMLWTAIILGASALWRQLS
jgi:hypothetical protein